MRRPAGKPLPGESAHEVDQGRHADDGERCEHDVSRATRPAQSGVDQGQPRPGQRNQKSAKETERHRVHRRHPLAGRAAR